MAKEIEKEQHASGAQPKEQKKEYREERFDFALYMNDSIICKRNFRINDYIERSMESLDFKNLVDSIVSMIDNDLKNKSMVYTWYYYNPDEPEVFDEYCGKKLEPWECTFKFVVFDNKRPVITRIWDGSGYPRAIREKVDITNRMVKITTKDGRVYTYDKESFYESNGDRISYELRILKKMIIDRPDLSYLITKMICSTCSTRGDEYEKIGDYVMRENYGKDAEGNDKVYELSLQAANRKVESGWVNYIANRNKEQKNA